ncbi:MAG: response regulator [Chloroflexi bacterium]|nr:response regulator [Chloroflexota bacterium]
MAVQSVQMLLVEDDDVDAEAIVRAFRKQKIGNAFTVVPDGIEAFRALRGEGDYVRLPRPYIILLDINMPRMNGVEFLQELRQDMALKHSIVFVITTSSRDEDVVAAYNEQIAGYILKSRVGEDFINLITMLDMYWRIVEFPSEAAA